MNPTTGWVVDFGGIVRAAGDLIVGQTRSLLPERVEGLENPTAERLAEWIWERVSVTVLGGKNAEGYRRPPLRCSRPAPRVAAACRRRTPAHSGNLAAASAGTSGASEAHTGAAA